MFTHHNASQDPGKSALIKALQRRKPYPRHRQRAIDPTTLPWNKQRSLQVDLMLDWADRVARLNKQGRVL